MAASRYRCSACGNLTRFDVTTTRTTRAFHHYSVGGELTVEEESVLVENVDEVSCRWCGNGRAVEELGQSDEPGQSDGPGQSDVEDRPADVDARPPSR